MLHAFGQWFVVGLVLYGLAAGGWAVGALTFGRPIWPWSLVASVAWCAAVLGVAAVGIVWLARAPELGPIATAFGPGGALALGALWGSLLTAGERQSWVALWDRWLWRAPSLVEWVRERAGRARQSHGVPSACARPDAPGDGEGPCA